MELRMYWGILWRRLWIIALVVIIVGLYSGYEYYKLRKTPGAFKTNQSAITLKIGLQGNTANDHNYADYIAASESIADEFANGPVLSSPEFSKLVANQIQADMGQITQHFGANPDLGDITNAGAIGGSLSAGRAHSLVTVTVTWLQADGAWAIAKAVGEVTIAHVNEFFDYIVTTDAAPGTAMPIVAARITSNASGPNSVAGPSTNKPTQLLALVFIGLIIGIALAFLVEYLDDRIRGKDEVVHLLQLPVYGEVPRPPPVGPAKSSRSSAA